MHSTTISREQHLAPQKDRQRDLRADYLAHCLSSAARIQFRTAVSTIEFSALTNPENTLYEFNACRKALEQMHLIGRLLREDGHQVLMDDGPLDEKWHAELKRKLFFALNPSTQEILKEQGLQLWILDIQQRIFI